MAVLVFGHINPDTDTVCSAIAYAWHLSQKGQEAQPRVLGEVTKETALVLAEFGHEAPLRLDQLASGDKVVIVDTNNPEELPSTLSQAEIIEVVDHHKLVGGLSTSNPLSVTLRPVACTATVIWELMQREGVVTLPREIAGVMLGAILSDTLNFTSPTTTEQDKQVASELAALAAVDCDDLAKRMFDAKSDISDKTPADLLTLDSKLFTFGGKKVRISSLETVKPENALTQLTGIQEAISDMKQRDELYAVFLFVVDILASCSYLIVNGDTETQAANASFEGAWENGAKVLPGVVSRKKQMVPPLEKFFN